MSFLDDTPEEFAKRMQYIFEGNMMFAMMQIELHILQEKMKIDRMRREAEIRKERTRKELAEVYKQRGITTPD